MDSIERSVGKIEGALETLIKRIDGIEEQVLGLRDDLNQRRGAKRALYFISATIGTVSGAVGAFIKSIFTTGVAQ